METNENKKEKKSLLNYIKTIISGFAIGIANVIPGVSGGTFALILGIYDEFIGAFDGISKWVTSFIRFLAGFKKENWEKHRQITKSINWLWILLLFIGILSAILATSRVITFLLIRFPAQTYGLFFGLILASVVVPWSKMEKKGIPEFIALIIAFVLLFWFSGLNIKTDYINPEMTYEKSDNAYKLSWEDTSDGYLYEIFRSDTESDNINDYTKINTIKDNTYEDTNIEQDKEYYYKIRTIVPIELQKRMENKNEIKLVWKRTHNATEYHIFRSNKNSDNLLKDYVKIKITKGKSYSEEDAQVNNIDLENNTEYLYYEDDDKIDTKTTYYYKIRAVSSEPNIFYVIFASAISAAAMILPGLSGAFLLLMFGVYGHIFGSFSTLITDPLNSIGPIIIYAFGMVIGLLAFSRMLKLLLKKYHSITMGFLIGLMLGSLRKIYPFLDLKNTVPGTEADEIPKLLFWDMPSNIGLGEYLTSMEFISILSCLIIGLAVVIVLYIATKSRKKKQNDEEVQPKTEKS